VRDSQYNLGILYARGLGVPRDLAASYKWFAIAAAAGDADSAKKRDDVAQVLEKDALARARLAVETWKPKTQVPLVNDNPPVDPAWAAPADSTASIDQIKVITRTQQILGKMGYDAGPADGKMGKKTHDAIAAFQKDHGLKPTGEVDEDFVRAIVKAAS